MNTRTHAHNAGFTLVEILIVVVILGILSAIVIPQFTNASETAKASAVTTQLQTIRSQLELYRVQHNGDYPTATQLADWSVMTGKTNADGDLSTAEGATGDYPFGPYLQKAPMNSFNSKSAVAAAAAATAGWVYDADTGAIKASVKAAAATKAGFDVTTGSTDLEDIATYE